MKLSWKHLAFEELSLQQLYDILRLRSAIFVVEQDCAYQDMDGRDSACSFLMAYRDDGVLIASTRIVPAGAYYEEASIGRVVNHPDARGKGLGQELMRRSIEELERQFGPVPIRIGAQQYLLRFYQSLGFESTNKEYLEDGIPHVEMLRFSDSQK
ncbi:GNAT family N-acetyltransferase [Chitinophagales bacterium]|nr:GNAT family N-acetyltransferase [Chitinophagales bacterium]